MSKLVSGLPNKNRTERNSFFNWLTSSQTKLDWQPQNTIIIKTDINKRVFYLLNTTGNFMSTTRQKLTKIEDFLKCAFSIGSWNIWTVLNTLLSILLFWLTAIYLGVLFHQPPCLFRNIEIRTLLTSDRPHILFSKKKKKARKAIWTCKCFKVCFLSYLANCFPQIFSVYFNSYSPLLS